MWNPSRRTLLTAAAAPAVLRTYAFEYWDVFTRTRFTGNPLAVFLRADGLGNEQMQAIARETNLSETTFVFRQGQANRVRIFTPTGELDFAGHPTLGTAMCLWRKGMAKIVLEENVGPVPVEFRVDTEGVYGEMLQPEPTFAEEHDPQVVAKLAGLPVTDLDSRYPIQNVSTGRPNLLVMVKSLKAIQAVRVDWKAVGEYFATGDRARSFYFLTAETEAGGRYHARKLTPRTEDPVTGSAAGSAIAWLVSRKLVGSGERIVIEQGAEVSRPGQLFVSAERAGNGATRVKVGGYCVKAWSGEMRG